MMQSLKTAAESWPIAGNFTISRGSKTEAKVVVATISDNGAEGRGECVPYPRYGESVESVIELIESVAGEIAAGADRQALQTLLPPGAARNALDCAFLDLEAKRAGRRVWDLIGLPAPGPLLTAYTISLDTPENMAAAAVRAGQRPLLKLKLGGDEDEARLRAIRNAVPDKRLIIDANEAWTDDNVEALMHVCAETGIALIEQPLPASADSILAEIAHPVPVCADESIHGLRSLDAIASRYDAINIKLDKTGGITEALALAEAAEKRGMTIMVGCMLATSLAMAPATLVAQRAEFVDLDGPLLLARDREPGLTFEGSRVLPPDSDLWG